MSLLHVQRSPSPFDDDVISSADSEEWSSGAAESPRSRSLSECFFAVRGAAIILPHSDGGLSPTSSRGCEIEAHLQLMVKALRPVDTLKLAVRLQTQVPDHVAYLALVQVAVGASRHSSLLLGMDYYQQQMTIGVVMPLTRDSQVSLVGDGGIRLCSGGSFGKPEHSLLFRPVSVQTMWYVFQSLHRALESERAEPIVKAVRGNDTNPAEHYSKKISSPDVLCTLWQQSPTDSEWVDELRADGIRGRDGSESGDQRELRRELRNIMAAADLEAVTTKDIKKTLSEATEVEVDRHKEFVDREILVILGQMEKPSQIFPYLYLGTEWNASNWDELQANNVGFILNMTEEVDNFFPHRFVYKKIWVADESGTHLLSHWNQTYKFIKGAKDAGKSVLVHCKKGISRSSSTVIAYAMKEYEWGLEKAIHFVKSRRHCVTPNDGFMEQLKMFAGALEASRNRELFTKEADEREREKRQGSASPVERNAGEGEAVKGIVRAFERGEVSESPPRAARFPLDIVSKRASIPQTS